MPDPAGGESNSPRGLINQARQLSAHGRIEEAGEVLRRVFLLPDLGLSHALARMLLTDLRERQP